MASPKITYLLNLVLILCAISAPLYALPEGEKVVSGEIDIINNDRSLLINQQSQTGIIEYDEFNLGVDEHITFSQPSQNSITLNRVVGNQPSEIFGQIHSNGQLVLVNTSGIFFSESSHLDVGGIVVSTLDIDNKNFLQDEFTFEGDSSARIENRGNIFSRDDGYIAIIGNDIVNTGSITSHSGSVGILSGKKVLLGFEGDTVAYDVTALSENSSVLNEGSVTGSTVELNLQSSDSIENIVINNDGVIKATGFEYSGGEIIISSNSGTVVNHGDITVNGSAQNHNIAGEINVQAERFIHYGSVAASATENGDGGEIDIHTTDALYLADGSETEANGADYGDGGTIIHYSDNAAWFAPAAESHAQAGENGGDGGFIEVSGREYIAFAGQVNTVANNGRNGTVLIDPTNIDIENFASIFIDPGTTGDTYILDPIMGSSILSVFTVEQTLLSGNSVIISTDNTDTPGEPGTLNVNYRIDLTGVTNQTLTLQSNGDMAINANVCASDGAGGCVPGMHDTNLAFETFNGDGGSISSAPNVIIDSGGGTITFNSDVNINLAEGTILEAEGADINLSAGNTVSLPNSGLSLEASTLSINAVDVFDTVDRTLNIDTQAINLNLSAPQGDLQVDGYITDFDIQYSTQANFTHNVDNVPVNTFGLVSLNNIDLAGGDLSVSGLDRRANIELVNYANVTNMSLVTGWTFANVFVPGTIDINGTLTINTYSIRNSLTNGGRVYGLSADTLNLATRSWGGPETLNSNVNTLNLNFGALRLTNRFVINEQDDLSITGIDQTIESDLTINVNGDVNIDGPLVSLNQGDTSVNGRTLDISSSGGSVNINNDLTFDTGDHPSTLVNIDAANDINVADGTQIASNNGNINLNANGQIQIGDGAEIDSGLGIIDMAANSIAANGLITSDAVNSQAVSLNSGSNILGGVNHLISAENGGISLIAQSGIDVSTSTTEVEIQNLSSGNVSVSEVDNLSLSNTSVVNDLTVQLNSGELTIADSGISTPGRLTLVADGIINESGNSDLVINASELVFVANASSQDIVLNTNIDRIDAIVTGNDFSIINENSLSVVDLDNDSAAMNVMDGNVSIEVSNGDLNIDNRVLVTDSLSDDDRTGTLAMEASNGNVLIGLNSQTDIIVQSDLDVGAAITNEYSDNTILAVNHNNNEQGARLNIGNTSGQSVNLTVSGGDFVADYYDEENSQEFGDIFIGENVNLTLNSSQPGGAPGVLYADGVDTSLATIQIDNGLSAFLIKQALSLQNPNLDLIDLIADSLPDEQADTENGSGAPNNVNAQNTRSTDSFLGPTESNCNSYSTKEKIRECNRKKAYRRFFNAFLISGELPSFNKNAERK